MKNQITITAAVLTAALTGAAANSIAAQQAQAESAPLTGTNYYFPNVDIDALEPSDVPQNCFWKAWYSGNYFAYSKNVPLGSGNNPETWVTYSPAKFKLPKGSTLILKGEYPHARYVGIDTYSGPFPVDAIAGYQIAADENAENTFIPQANRNTSKRGFTLKLVEQVKPAVPAANTLYLRPASAESYGEYTPELRYRVYFPDRGQDVLGGVGYPKAHALELADGSVITGEENICRVINTNTSTGDLSETALPLSLLKVLVDSAPNPARAPAQEVPTWERFFNVPYSHIGLFMLPGGEKTRSQIPVPRPDGGGGGSLAGTIANAYVATYLSHETKDREVAVTTVKVANTPKTFDGHERLNAIEPIQAQYWSMCTNVDVSGVGNTEEGFPTGVRQGMCHNDETVVLNSDRFTRIVHTSIANRPQNATNACGWSWLNSGPNDGFGRPVTQVLLRPGLSGESDFAENSVNVLYPGTEQEVMGDYLPVTKYMSVAEFEAMGCNNDGFVQAEGRPDLPAPVWGTEQMIKPAYPELKLPKNMPMPKDAMGILNLLKKVSQQEHQ